MPLQRNARCEDLPPPKNWTYYGTDRVVLELKENNMEAHHRWKFGAHMSAGGAYMRGARLITSAAAVLGATALLPGCVREGVLDPHGPISGAERLILLNATGIMLVVVVPVILMTLAFAWWYRASNSRAAYDPDWDYSGHIELVTWSIPAMVVILLAGVGWTGSHDLDPAQKLQSSTKPIRIQGVSLDWKWLFIYPDQGVATVNQLVVPAGAPIEFSLSSATVMNSFFIPQLGSMIYTMPGMTTQLNLLAESAGEYRGFSAQFSGDGFSDMRFPVNAVSSAEFPAWVERARTSSETLDAATYGRLAAPGTVAAQTYGGVTPHFYEWIVARTVGAPIREP
jgi:cytochrome o ubiquinol oxidase subunit 2